MIIDTLSTFAALTNPSANVTSSSFTEPTAQQAVPTGVAGNGDGIINLGRDGGLCANAMKLWFFGVGSDSTTFLANVYGWEELHGTPSSKLTQWVPTLLATFTGITLDSAQPGVAGTLVVATSYYATAITLGVGNSGTSVEVVSPGHSAHQIAHVVVDMKGARIGEVRYSTGSSATSCNGVYKKM